MVPVQLASVTNKLLPCHPSFLAQRCSTLLLTFHRGTTFMVQPPSSPHRARWVWVLQSDDVGSILGISAVWWPLFVLPRPFQCLPAHHLRPDRSNYCPRPESDNEVAWNRLKRYYKKDLRACNEIVIPPLSTGLGIYFPWGHRLEGYSENWKQG